jgi:hypothetical protein
VRRIVVGQVHRDDNSVEVANLWHIVSFLLSCGCKDTKKFPKIFSFAVKSSKSLRKRSGVSRVDILGLPRPLFCVLLQEILYHRLLSGNSYVPLPPIDKHFALYPDDETRAIHNYQPNLPQNSP